jgi:hypothetical protein
MRKCGVPQKDGDKNDEKLVLHVETRRNVQLPWKGEKHFVPVSPVKAELTPEWDHMGIEQVILPGTTGLG